MNREQIRLSVKDRILLTNQYLILEALYPDSADTYKQMREIVEKGYELHYNDLHPMIFESGLTDDQCREVMDVLDMHRALNYSYRNIKDKGGIVERDLQFPGFDGNNETNYLSYARFLVLTQRRWEEVFDGRPGFDLNSHSGVIEMYRRMLAAWEKLDKKHDLSVAEIKLMLAARIHPEHSK